MLSTYSPPPLRKNPYGYLPGELHGFLDFFFLLAVVYVCIGALWALGCVCLCLILSVSLSLCIVYLCLSI